MASTAFKVHRGTTVISSGSATATITEGTHYTLDASSDGTNCFCRINNTRITGMGRTSGGATQYPDDFSVFISSGGSPETSITFTRYGLTNDCRVTWEIIEYLGSGDNEIVVREIGSFTDVGFTTSSVNTGAISGIVSDSDCVVFITGQACEQTGTGDWHSFLWTGRMSSGTAYLDRLTSASGGLINLSYAVVEFTGSNWTVNRQEFDTSVTTWGRGNDNSGTVALSTSVADTSKTFLYCQYSTSNDGTGLDDAGDAVTLDSTTNLRLINRSSNGTRRKVVWIIENSQADGTARNLVVQRGLFSSDTTGGTEETEWDDTISTVDALDETSAFATASVDGSGSAYPRGAYDVRLTSTTNIKFTESDNGQERRIYWEVVEWPEDPDAGGTDDLTAQDISASTSTVDQATVGQTHVLASQDVSASASTVDQATVAEIHALTSQDISASTATVDQSTLSESHLLTAQDISASASTVDQGAIAQKHVLASQDISSAASVVDQADIGQIHALSSQDISASAATVDQATAAQAHVLASQDISASAATVDQATVAQIHALASQDVSSAAATVDQAAMAEIHLLMAQDILSGVSTVDQPTATEIAPDHLTAQDISATAATVDQATMAVIHALSAQDIVAGGGGSGGTVYMYGVKAQIYNGSWTDIPGTTRYISGSSPLKQSAAISFAREFSNEDQIRIVAWLDSATGSGQFIGNGCSITVSKD